jgi:hypothetical protein
MCTMVIDPGICNFQSEVRVKKKEKYKVDVTICSDCPQLLQLNEMLDSLDVRDIFMPPARNIVFTLSEKAGCHASCPVPLAVLKCAEVELGLALPRDVMMSFRK